MDKPSAPAAATVTDLSVGLQVRLTGGKYNGFEGQISKLCDNHAAFYTEYEGQVSELITENINLTPLQQWRDTKTATELALKGHQ